jgi:hypothetical protein
VNQKNADFITRYASHPMRKEVESALSAAEKFKERAKAIAGN